MKLMGIVVSTKQSVLSSWVNKFHSDITGDWSFVFLHTKFCFPLLKYNLWKKKKEGAEFNNREFTMLKLLIGNAFSSE